MKHGIQHGIGDTRWTPEIFLPESLTAFCSLAERVGFDLLAFTDHPAPSGRWVDQGGEGTADPFTSLAYCAAVTERMRLLTFVLAASYRNPFLAAHQAATLDRLSGGRLTVGLGTGYLFGEFKALGADPTRRRTDMDELLELWEHGFAGGDIAVETDRFSARDARILPPTLQQPRPPLWIHANSAFGRSRAISHGQGAIFMLTPTDEMAASTRTAPLKNLDDLSIAISTLKEDAERAGRDPRSLDVVVAGPWGMLDVRDGASAEQIEDYLGVHEQLGVDWTVSLVCGDDVSVCFETLEWFGSEFLEPCS